MRQRGLLVSTEAWQRQPPFADVHKDMLTFWAGLGYGNGRWPGMSFITSKAVVLRCGVIDKRHARLQRSRVL